jgi:hypothetical protein
LNKLRFAGFKKAKIAATNAAAIRDKMSISFASEGIPAERREATKKTVQTVKTGLAVNKLFMPSIPP